MKDTIHYPPPWNLNGEGFIIPFLGKRKIIDFGFISTEDKLSFRGGLGACMLVNYKTSNVGQYFELLFIPGDFEYKENGKKSKKYKKITKIFVSSEISIQEGRLNWAIPKEFANFEWVVRENTTQVKVTAANGDLILETSLTKKFFPFPVTTKIYPVSLLQKADKGVLLNTQFSGNGSGKFSTIEKWIANEKYFVNLDDIAKFKMGLSVTNFSITFLDPKTFSS